MRESVSDTDIEPKASSQNPVPTATVLDIYPTIYEVCAATEASHPGMLAAVTVARYTAGAALTSMPTEFLLVSTSTSVLVVLMVSVAASVLSWSLAYTVTLPAVLPAVMVTVSDISELPD